MEFVITFLKGFNLMSFQQYNIYPGLTPVRVVSTSNIAGTYFNGQNNNGVGATLTIAASSLTIDSVVCVAGDRVLLQTQTNTNEQGMRDSRTRDGVYYKIRPLSKSIHITRWKRQE